jgi:hypothetical protein
MEVTMQKSDHLKVANLGGGGGEREFEQAFSSLAYAYLRDKAPRLLDHMVGFQLIDRNEDNTKAIGVFGFNVDRQWIYAPVFFLNGDLKGHELLYIKNNDSFVPMKENWINYLMSRKPHVLGESSARELQDLGGLYPDIRSLSIPPSIGGGKRASDNSWLADVLPMLAAFKVKSASSLYPGAGNRKLSQSAVVKEPFAAALAKQASNLDFNKVLPHSLVLMKQAHAMSEAYPGVKRAMQRFYGVDCFSRWGKEYKEAVKKASECILSEKKAEAKPFMPGNLLIPTERPAGPVDHVKEGKLRMYVYEHVTIRQAPELSDEDREQLLQDTVLIKDERTGEEVSKAYNTQVEAKLTNPSETALYRVLVKPGEFKKMLIAINGTSNRGREAMATVVRLEGNGDGSDKAWLNTHPTNVFADQISDRSEWDEWFESLPETDSLSEGGEYIIIGEDGSTTAPFHVQSSYGEGRYRVDFRTNIDWNETRPATMPSVANGRFSQTHGWDSDQYASPYGAMLYLNKEGARGSKIRAIAGELRIPGENYKAIQLKAPQKPKDGELMSCCEYDSRSDMPPINLGKIDDIQLLFHEKTARLKVYNNSTDVYINSPLGEQRLSKKAAFLDLVSNHGLREKVAREILEVSERKGSAIYRVAYAPGYGTEKSAQPNASILSGGPSAPMIEDFAEDRSVENYGPRTSAPTIFGSEQAFRVEDASADNTDPSVYDPFQNYQAEDFQTSVQVAQQAGADGQKEVFDTAMISGMLKAVRQDSLVERYLGSLMEALDALGRLLLNFYWHQEEFSDRYGKADMPELEDSIRNAFESLGDITLFLKEKTIESPFDEGDVDIEEVARN